MKPRYEKFSTELDSREKVLLHRMNDLRDTDGEVADELLLAAQRELENIDKAREMIKEGIYGICEICHKRIPIGRLRAEVAARTHVTCGNPSRIYRSISKNDGEERDYFADDVPSYFTETGSNMSAPH